MTLSFLYTYRKWLSFLLILLAVAGLPFLRSALTPNNALTVWFLEDDPNLLEYYAFHEEFGNDETILLAVEDTDGIFSQQTLQQIRDLSLRISSILGVDTVLSIATLKDLGTVGQELLYLPLVPEPVPQADSVLKQIRDQAVHSQLLRNRIINSDATITLLLIQMEVMADIDRRRNGIVQEVRDAANEIVGEDQTFMGGFGVIYAGLNIITQRDFGLFMSLSYLLMFSLIWLLYRNLKIVFLAMGSILTATLLTLEVFGLMGFQINLITLVVPTLIIILGIMDVMHLINAWYFVNESGQEFSSQKDKILATLHKVARPCLFTTLTTMAGLLSLTITPMAVLRQFGSFSALGMCFSLICAFVFSPWVFSSMKEIQILQHNRWLDRRLNRLPGHLLAHRRWYVAGFALLMIGMGWGANKIVVDTYSIQYLPAEHPVLAEHNWLEENWGEYFLLEFTLRPDSGKSLKDPDLIQAMRDFVAEAREMDDVRDAFGLHTVYEHVFPLVHGVGWERRLRQKGQVNLLTRRILREDSMALRPLVRKDFALGRLSLTGKMMSAANLSRKLQEASEMGERHFEGLASLKATGYPPLYSKIITYVMASQIRSFFVALVLIFLLMWFMLKSLPLTLLAMLPNLFPVLLMLGRHGLVGGQFGYRYRNDRSYRTWDLHR